MAHMRFPKQKTLKYEREFLCGTKHVYNYPHRITSHIPSIISELEVSNIIDMQLNIQMEPNSNVY